MSIELLYKLFLQSTGVSTDTRNSVKGSIFFCLQGNNFKGNMFANEAIAKGALYAIVDKPIEPQSSKFIYVEDTLRALQELATHHRKKNTIPLIAITGSNGKTTTKELTSIVLSTKKKVHSTKGNLNNHIGVPLTLLSMPADTEIAVIEMGASHEGEITKLCYIAQPDYGIITNIGKAHLEGFGDYRGVLRAKSELYHYILKNGKNIFINSQDDVLNSISQQFKKPISYPNKDDFFSSIFIKATPYVQFRICDTTYTTNLIGKYNFHNIVAALTIGTYFNIALDKSTKAICNYKPVNNRSQLINTKKNKLILDAYNANPTSMKEAIANFSAIDDRPKLVILGDMLELGEDSKKEHEVLGKFVSDKKFEMVFFCGKEIKESFSKCSRSLYFITKQKLADYLIENPIEGFTILIKASRSIQLETLITAL